VDFLILGSIEVIEEERSLPLGGPKQRALLALLLLDANEAVTRDRLVEGIWGDQPPESSDATLDSYVSRLRKLLGPDRIARRGGGYALRVKPGELDLDRFEQLAASERFADALVVWRGPALADLLFAPFAAREAERLEERRLNVLEERIERELAAGAGTGLVGELEQLVREHPFRERLLGQLMVALYRAGRHTAALEAYRRAKRNLSEELGLEPGPQIQQLERRILAHDPALVARQRAPARPLGRRRRLAAVAVLVASAGCVIAAAVVWRAHPSRGLTAKPAHASQLVALRLSPGGLARSAALPGTPAAMTAAAGSLWLADPGDQTVLRADARSGSVIDRIPVSGQPGSLAAGAAAVWVASTLNGTIERIDPPTGTVTQTIRLGQEHTSGIALGRGGLWVADTTDDALIELDLTTGASRRTLTLNVRPTSLAVGDRAIWVADYDAGSVSEVDAGSGQTVATIRVGNGPAALTLGGGALWVANSLDSTVSKIDPETASVVATIPVGSGPSALADADGAVWVANQYSGTVSRVDPQRNVVTTSFALGGQPAAVAIAGGLVWVGAGPAADSHRGGTLVLASSMQPYSIDPGIYYFAAVPQFLGLEYDTLVTFARTSGPDGLRLVPDLATQVPEPAGGGTVYSFRLRPGIRYSDGRLLRAGDFRRALERLFSLRSPGLDYYAAIVGFGACHAHPATCDLSRGIVTNDRAGTVAFHLSKPDPDFLFKLTEFAFSAPVPPGTPEHDAGYQPIPGTGPYEIASATRQLVRFVRNPHFHEWSHAAQPEGNPDLILWRFSSSHQQTVRWVESGRADWTLDLISPAEIRTIHTHFPAQLHSNPLFGIEFFPLNTNIPPFDDVRVRRALNFAIDRRKIQRMYGGALAAAPACQPLVPGLAGYDRYCPYTVDRTPDGAYHGPDLGRARRLVTASGTAGERVDVWAASHEVIVPPRIAYYVGNVLRSLGFRVRVHVRRLGQTPDQIRRRFQISTDGDWLPDYPAASSYLPSFFSCGGGHSNGYVCDPALDAAMRKALALELQDPAKAASAWRRVDHEVTDRAYWVPTVDARAVELTSKRLRNYEFHPVWGFIADQAWVGSRTSAGP
jgi:YVTN family beta-propeller protein